MNTELVKELEESGVLTPEKFSLEVERRVMEEGEEASYLSHTAGYLDELDIDPEDGKALISKSLYDKIKNEAFDKNMMKEKSFTSKLF